MATVSITDLTNAKLDTDHIADIATSLALTATDRLGTTKKTLQGAINSIAAITDRGTWTTATAYAVKDVVLDTGVYYICITAHTSGGTFAGDSAKWRVYQGDLGTYHSVDVVNDIRSNDFSNRKMIRIATERGNPVYYLDSADTTSADDDFLVIVDFAGNRFKLVHDGTVDVRWAGAKGDGVTDDTVAVQKSIVAAGIGGTVLFSRTPYNVYVVNGQLKFKTGQHWVGEGGIDLSISGNSGTTVKLNSTTTSFIEAETKGSAITFGFRVSGIFFDTNNFADVAVDLTNTNYSMLEQFAARANKAGAAAVLFDSTGGQCYFNQLVMPRLIAQGVGGVCARFDNGANVNTIVGGKFGSSTRGVEFFNLSTGNTIVSGEFETITDKGAFVDSTSNKFISCYFEDMPIGIDITVNGNDTGILGNTYATSTIINVQDASKLGAQCDIHREPGGITGKLQFGPAKFSSSYLSGDTTLAYDPSLASATANAVLNLFRFTTTTGTRQFNIYKGDGSSTLAFNVNADTGQVRHNDILQGDDAGAVFRKTVRRNAAPTTGTWSQGDIVFSTTPSAGGFVGWVCTTAGSPGTWKTFGAIST